MCGTCSWTGALRQDVQRVINRQERAICRRPVRRRSAPSPGTGTWARTAPTWASTLGSAWLADELLRVVAAENEYSRGTCKARTLPQRSRAAVKVQQGEGLAAHSSCSSMSPLPSGDHSSMSFACVCARAVWIASDRARLPPSSGP